MEEFSITSIHRRLLMSTIKGMIAESKFTKKVARHHLLKMNALRNVWPWNKKHIKGETRPEKPERPKFVERADAWGDAQGPEVLQAALDEQYGKFWGLDRYRRITLSRRLRSHHLAYGFLKGNTYAEMEAAGCYMKPDFATIKKLAEEHGVEDIRVTQQKWAEWHDAALKALGVDTSVGLIGPSSSNSSSVAA